MCSLVVHIFEDKEYSSSNDRWLTKGNAIVKIERRRIQQHNDWWFA